MKKKHLALLCALALALSLLAGCGGNGNDTPVNEPPVQTPAEPQDTPAEPDTPTEPEKPAGPAIAQITIGTTSAIETACRDEYAFDMLASGTSELPLVYQDTAGDYHPLLASYTTEDSATWTYTIRDGMTWSDGEPVTAEDILYTLQYEDENGSANLTDQTDSEGKTTTAKYTGYELSADKMSISLTLATPNVRELSNMTSFRTLPKHIYEGKETLTEDEMRIGCGPYAFESFNKDAGTISFTVNPYYPETPNVERLVYQIFGNEDTMYMALQNGDIDMTWNYSTGVSATYQDVLAAADSVTLVNVVAANAPAVLAFNNANGPLADLNLRLAVTSALEYVAFRTYFGSPYAESPNRGFVPACTLGYKSTEQLKTDLDAAAKYMEAAGYTEKNADGFYVDANGAVAGFALTLNGDRANHVGYAELIKTNLEDFGIQVTLDAVDGTSYNAKTSNKFSENNITMEAAIFGYTAAGMGMGNGLASIYVDGTHAVQGGCQVYDESFQAIQGKLSAATSIEEYKAAAGELQDFYAGNMPLVALYWDNMMYVHSSRYENVAVDYTFGLNNVNNWFSITAK